VSRWRRASALALLAVVGGAGVWTLAGARQDTFPHEAHARLFPTCVGCHEGIPAGNEATYYPPPESCVPCHDGVRRRAVDWAGPERRPTNLTFTHPRHAAVAGEPLPCLRCHGTTPQPAWMQVAEAEPWTCLSCHAHEATSHLALDSECRVCHVPVAQARALPVGRIAGFARPATHDDPDFISNHAVDATGAVARCAVCHTRDSCDRCHLNGNQVPAIAALERDERVASLVARLPAEYPLPPSHLDPEWLLATHGPAAVSNIQSCANCHTQPGCRSCHVGTGGARVIAALPMPRPGGPAGAIITGLAAHPTAAAVQQAAGRPPLAAPERVSGMATLESAPTVATRAAVRIIHPPGFEREHRAAAAADQPRCTVCHTKQYCSDCHDGASRPRFHLANYLSRHAADVYAARTECTACHNTQVFCQACHETTGLRSQGRLDAAFHNAQPLWLLQHAKAARQNLTSCTTCHTQRDCMQCHSQIGWGVSPHGPGFDARRMADRNQMMCARCHLGDPLRAR
jgi:cytochrome c553